MDTFKRNYKVYYSALRIAGLWPFTQSIILTFQRIAFCAMTICCIMVQIVSIRKVEFTLRNILTMLSFTFPLLLFILRYVSFIINFPLMKSMFKKMEYDCNMIRDPDESEILARYIRQSNTAFYVYFGMSTVASVMVVILVVIPTLLGCEFQLTLLQFAGFFYFEHNITTDLICLYAACTFICGLMITACTESSFSIMTHYLCGLYEIVGYVQMLLTVGIGMYRKYSVSLR
ncbi:uncharacterized protein LOC144477439 [Augochlora pura]